MSFQVLIDVCEPYTKKTTSSGLFWVVQQDGNVHREKKTVKYIAQKPHPAIAVSKTGAMAPSLSTTALYFCPYAFLLPYGCR